ncbi:hypothetical protein [Streptomyces scabiei]|uniref:hypothetical protein n=1 Tax=Streptomyces scabiei TaxID=1930 RepID=UPI001B30FF32|nr:MULTISPECIES: hypothetical protein [Streptomyces]MBP5870816.1 hypothetical protein [Streptomyces sp. LBUM 1485]MBP5913278.1 hypothetical protein [Streptomyces sp. LBUM 1486]MDX2532250.1 hypothetical protein [Streptomyces scabiei]MDX2794556.1 hypothetical protein [Streptomyces scabiei]MDX3822442.1 hypothetical protein [Streptomyces scabiei]
MNTPVTDTAHLSPECAVAQRPGYEHLHGDCRQDDIPLPGAVGVLLQTRCPCDCHSPKARKP